MNIRASDQGKIGVPGTYPQVPLPPARFHLLPFTTPCDASLLCELGEISSLISQSYWSLEVPFWAPPCQSVS